MNAALIREADRGLMVFQDGKIVAVSGSEALADLHRKFPLMSYRLLRRSLISVFHQSRMQYVTPPCLVDVLKKNRFLPIVNVTDTIHHEHITTPLPQNLAECLAKIRASIGRPARSRKR
jgi:hypothetical protein